MRSCRGFPVRHPAQEALDLCLLLPGPTLYLTHCLAHPCEMAHIHEVLRGDDGARKTSDEQTVGDGLGNEIGEVVFGEVVDERGLERGVKAA
jgi:hypothetical protein